MMFEISLRRVSATQPVKPRRLAVLMAAVAVVAPSTVRAADLSVDLVNGNSPFTFTGTTTYDTVRVAVSSTGTLTQNSGTLTANTALIVAANANSIGTYNLGSTGVLNVVGPATVGLAGNGTFNQNAGTATFNGGLTLSGATNGRGTYNLNGGTLATSLIRGNINGGTNATFTFNGGTLRPTASSITFFQGLTAAYIRNSGVTVDTNGQNITVNQALLHSNVSGDAAKDGGIVKIGTGTLTLAGASTYTGDTIVSAGTLAITGSIGVPYQFAISPLNYFRVNGTTTPVVNLSGGGSIQSYTSTVGNNNKAIFNQAGGTHTVADALDVGRADLFDNSGSNGAYNLSGGTLNANTTNVGNGGTGSFAQTGGTFSTQLLQVGYAPNAQNIGNGTYTLGGTGQLTTLITVIGAAAPGSFTQTAGTHTNSNLTIGANGGTGTYGLSGTGQLTTRARATIGSNGTGTFNHSAGTFKVGQLTLGSGGANSTYTLGGTGLLQVIGLPAEGSTGAVPGDLFVNSGKFTQTGGTDSIAGRLVLGNGVAANATADYGTYALSSGKVSSAQTLVGDAGRGTFTQTGGTHTAGGLNVATAGGTGAYALGGTGTLVVNGNALIGSGGIGTFTQTAGTNNVSGTLYLGFPGQGSATTGTGTFNLSGGTLTTNGTQVANFGAGTFNQTGGTHTTPQMLIGLNSANGVYNLSGTGVLNNNGALVVGYSGPGTFNQTGGTVTATGNLYLSAGTGGVGTYNLNGGTVTAIGVFGNTSGGTNAVFNFNGGTLRAGAANANFLQTLSQTNVRNNGLIFDTNAFAVTLGNTLPHSTVGGDAAIDGGLIKTGAGTLTLTAVNTYTGTTTVTAGTLAITAGGVGVQNTTAAFTVDGLAAANATALLSGTATLRDNVAYVGRAGTGTLNQTAGTHLVNTVLYVGNPVGTTPVAASNGTYALSGGTLQTSETQIANRGAGTFTQTGGAHKPNQLSIGLNGSTGSYALSGTGQLTVTNASAVGVSGTGTLTQSGGTHSAANLYVGFAGATGNYNLSAGQLSTGTNAFVGYGGAGTLTQSGGTANVVGTLFLGYAASAATTGNGTYTLSNGGLATNETQVGNTGTGTFVQTGGTLTTPRFFLGLTGGTGTYNLSGTGQLNTSAFAAVGLGGPATLNQTGGTATFAGGLYVAGGTGGSGTYNLNGGILAAKYVTGTKNGGTNATFNFNGGTLRPTTADPDYLEGMTAANVRNGGARIDTNGIDTGINQLLRHSTISGDAAVDGGLTKLGTGTLTLTGANSYTGATTVSAGTLSLVPAAYADVLANAGGANVAGGRLVLNYTGATSPAAQVKSILSAGYPNNFATGQIRSTTLTAGQTLGYGDDGSAVSIVATLPGDANLNGTVDFNDFLVLQNNFGSTATRFDQGNFNYDGSTDFNDFLVLQNHFGQSVAGAPAATVTAAQVAAIRAFAATAAVPEPAGVLMFSLVTVTKLRRRRR